MILVDVEGFKGVFIEQAKTCFKKHGHEWIFLVQLKLTEEQAANIVEYVEAKDKELEASGDHEGSIKLSISQFGLALPEETDLYDRVICSRCSIPYDIWVKIIAMMPKN